MNLEDWVGDPGHMITGPHTMITKWARYHRTVIPELKLTKVTTDEEGTKFMMPRIVVDVSRYREVERRRFYVLCTDIEAPGHMGSCPGYALLTSQGEAAGFRERIGMTFLAGDVRREICKDRVAERKRVRGKRGARIERGAGDVPEEPGINMLSRWRFDMRTHLAVTS